MTKINNCKKWKIYQWSYSLIVGYLSFMTFGSFVVEKYCSSSSSSETSSSLSLSDSVDPPTEKNLQIFYLLLNPHPRLPTL
eukprot:UN22519